MKTYISIIKSGRDLTAKESENAFTDLLRGMTRDSEIAEFLLALKEKGETAEEILGAARMLKARERKINLGEDVLDVCGTGGDSVGTLNVSTAVAIIAAGAGVRVAKHGNRAITSKSGSADVLAELGVSFKNPEKQMELSGMCFLFAPDFHPAVRSVAEIRKKLNTRTIFNLLGPVLNPAGAKRQLIGVYAAKLLRIYAEVLRQLGSEKAWIAHGGDGLDEISISSETFICELSNGTIDNFTVKPEDAGLQRYHLKDIKGGDSKFNANAMEELLRGEKSTYREIVLLNTAAALIVAGKVNDLKSGAVMAAESIDSGKAKLVLENLRAAAA